MKKLIIAFVLFTLTSVLIVACSQGSGSSSGSGGTAMHMGDANFVQPGVTIHKGGSLNLIDDVSAVHIIANGSWVDGIQRPATESGAPRIDNLQFDGNDSHLVGPFNTAGTYHLYCIVHPGMNLTVTVQ